MHINICVIKSNIVHKKTQPAKISIMKIYLTSNLEGNQVGGVWTTDSQDLTSFKLFLCIFWAQIFFRQPTPGQELALFGELGKLFATQRLRVGLVIPCASHQFPRGDPSTPPTHVKLHCSSCFKHIPQNQAQHCTIHHCNRTITNIWLNDVHITTWCNDYKVHTYYHVQSN